MTVIHDYQEQYSLDKASGERTGIDLPISNVLQFLLKDGSKISIRPSGTEPKIKFYFSVHEVLENRESYEKVKKILEARIEGMKKELKLT